LAKPVGQYTTSRTCANNNVIVFFGHFLSLP
jgi:hypothetical protein